MKKDLVSLTKVSKSFVGKEHGKGVGENRPLFNDLSFSIQRSEFVAIFGPNGSGKTTLLNMIAGIDTDFTGICKRDQKIKVSFVFQNYRESLLPWLTVEQNIAFPLVLKKVSLQDQSKAVLDLCTKLSVSINLEAYPYTLSGGQQQMVSILRALIVKPDLLLMDEPFSALDYETTLFLLEKTQDIWKKTGVAIVFVSHEVDDAVLLAERIIVLGRDPTRVVSEVVSNLAYPRDERVMNSEDFHQTKNKVLTAFLKGYKKETVI